MAIGRISGAMLKSNLLRQGTDLAFETNLLYVDVNNGRIGVNTDSPTKSLHVDNVTVENNQIRSTTGVINIGDDAPNVSIGGGAENYVLTTDGNGNLFWSSISGIAGGDGESSGLTGMDIILSMPDDSSLYPTGAINDWQTSTKVTNAIDDLNELAQNIVNNTAVINVDFVADVTRGGAPFTTTLTITAEGNPNRYTIDWGDGTIDTAISDSTPTHTYNDFADSPFDVTVTAFNNNGTGKGSSISKTREEYITVFTPDPVVSFVAYSAESGGSPITSWDDGTTIYFENTTTNVLTADIQFTWNWGDGASNDVITDDTASGGTSGGRIAHTFAESTEQDVSRTVRLTLDSHTTCDPDVIPASDQAVYLIYDTHTPTLTIDNDSGINEESTSGHVVTFTNTTEATIGDNATYGITYRYTFGDGDTQTVNVGSGADGDTSTTIGHTYALSSAQQAAGTAVDFTGNLQVFSNHTSSPFASDTFIIHVEPDVRAIIAGTAITVSDRTGDNQYDVYDGTDYNGVNRALVRVTNTSQNADDYVYDWNDGSTNDSVAEDGTSAGSIGATIDHDFSGVTPGNYTLDFTTNGTPDITAQTDTDSLIFQVNAIPSAPDGLSAKTITLSGSAQGTEPRLASGFTDNSDTNPLSVGADLNTTTAKRFTGTSGTIDTSIAQNAYDGTAGTVSAVINGSATGSKTFSTSLNENGTFTSLVISDQRDAHDTISASTYPDGFYQTFDAKISQEITSYSVGVNDQRIEHSTTGNTNYVSVMYDNLVSVPTIATVGALAEDTAGNYRYVSGIPYYNTGSPSVNLSGTEISDLVGQAYTNQSNIVEIDNGTNHEGTSQASISDQNYSYSDIDGAVSMLTGGIPNINTGTTSPYAIGDLNIPITTSSVRTIENIRVRARNVNGVTSYSDIPTKIQVHTAEQSGISEIAISVADALGNGTYTDDAVRIFDFSAYTTDTPTYNSATNFYTNSTYTESVDPGVAGTQEATIRLGVLEHNTNNYSTGYLPAGPDRSSDTGTQYFTFAFRRQVVANFTINIVSSTGVSGVWIAAPGEQTDNTSSLNGWLDCGTQYLGVGYPGSNTGSGGNGSNGCAFTGADVISTGVAINGSFTMTLGPANMSNTTNNVALVRIALSSGESITSLSIGDAT